MNIIVKTTSGHIIVRPDTTWEKDSEDFFPPEFVTELSYTPVFFARICKPGRSVGEKFASRYYDGIGYGVLLYPENLMDGHELSFAQACCLDHTSFLPAPFLEKTQAASFDVCKGTEVLASFESPSLAEIDAAIAEATRFVYIRTGDLLAIELDGRKTLCKRSEGSVEVATNVGGEPSMKFNIVM